ncbi:MAG: ATP synthase F1 subunit epsilon [Butyrivibrio sp.]
MADKKFDLQIMCPDRTFFKGEADMIELTTIEGQIGIYPGHIPLATVLAPGVMTIHNNGEEKKAALHSGIVEIQPYKVMILAEIAEWPDEIDLKRAEEAKIRAERRLGGDHSGIDLQRAEIALRKSLIRIAIKD